MDPITGTLIGGAMGLGGSYLNMKSQEQTNEMNRDIAREQMAFQERMSNSAHQRATKDLEAAGLNRILSATQGSGASTPAGASATMQSTRMGDILKDSVNTGMAGARLDSDLAVQSAAVAKTLAETKQALTVYPFEASSAESQANTHHWQAQSAREGWYRSKQELAQSREATKQERLRTQRESADTPRSVEKSQLDREWQKTERIMKIIDDGVGTAATSASMLTPIGRAAGGFRGVRTPHPPVRPSQESSARPTRSQGESFDDWVKRSARNTRERNSK